MVEPERAGGRLPRAVDTIVVGAGPAGVAVVDRLLRHSDRRVLLIEAGPDWGPPESGAWPPELLDPTLMPVLSHSWGYSSAAATGQPALPLERARVIGGCSSHNGCAAVWGHPTDYDAWEALGNPGWGATALAPLFAEANRRWQVVTPSPDEITPWQRACLDAAPAIGLPRLEALNDWDRNPELGIAIGPVNITDGLRWNIAFALLDPLRPHPRLQIAPDTLVDRLLFSGTRCTGLTAHGPGGAMTIAADEIILASGAYGSPPILLRSGIGPAAELAALAIDPVLDLPGVGRGLQDHPAFPVRFAGTPALVEAMDAFVAGGGLPREEGTIALARSARCEGPFDLHLYPVGSRPTADAGWRFTIASAVMNPKSTGTVRLTTTDPTAPPLIDHAYLSDPAGHDLEVLLDGIALCRDLAAQSPLAPLVGQEIWPGADPHDRDDLSAFVPGACVHDYHPSSSCRMGPASDPMAVVAADGRVHGLEGIIVADASIMPFVPRANTNLPALVVGWRIADTLLGVPSEAPVIGT